MTIENTYAERIRELEAENNALRTNPWFGVLTRNAFDQYLRSVEWTHKAIIYLDVDGLKQANNKWGKEESSRRIRAALSVRSNDIGTWFSGDEFALVVDIHDALGVALRLRDAFHAQNMSATFLIATGGTGPRDIDTAEKMLSMLKEGLNTHRRWWQFWRKPISGRDKIYIGTV